MKHHPGVRAYSHTILIVFLLIAAPLPAQAHCDGLDGPVVSAAREALKTRNIDPVLIWVLPEHENRIREAFESTLAVRGKGPEAKALADRYFFETLVRLHREGEGAPYTGLKPAGRDLGPAIPAADKALETGSIGELESLLVATLKDGLKRHFAEARAHRNFASEDVAAGRAFVARYVRFIHYVEAAYETLADHPNGHYPETAAEQSDMAD